MTSIRATAVQLSLLSKFTTCEVSDALLKLGVSTGGFIPDLQQLSGSTEGTLIGEAYTVQMVEQSDVDAPKLSGHFVDSAPKGSIMVISSPRTVKSASLGGLLALSAAVRGVKGVIIDGRCRDLAELRALSLPVFSRGQSTLGQSPFTRPSSIQVPLKISPIQPTSFEATTVYPFDLILADLDGVVVVRPEMVDVVLIEAGKGREVDERCRKDLEEGKGVKETFGKWRGK